MRSICRRLEFRYGAAPKERQRWVSGGASPGSSWRRGARAGLRFFHPRDPGGWAASARSSRCSRFVGLTRRIGRVFRDIGVHVIPRLSALDEDVSLGPKPAWIVEAGDADAHEIRPG